MTQNGKYLISMIAVRDHGILHILKPERTVYGKLKMKHGQGQSLVVFDLLDQLCLLPAFHIFLTEAKRSTEPPFPVFPVQTLLYEIYKSYDYYDQY
jgi:hypothetical protein